MPMSTLLADPTAFDTRAEVFQTLVRGASSSSRVLSATLSPRRPEPVPGEPYAPPEYRTSTCTDASAPTVPSHPASYPHARRWRLSPGTGTGAVGEVSKR